MSILFEPIETHGMKLKNRFVRSATHDSSFSEQGKVTDETIELFSGLARGGIGLIITGFAYVHSIGQALSRQAAIDSDDCILGLKRLADKVHEYDTKIAMQVVHSGRESRAARARGEMLLAPSFVEDAYSLRKSYREMTAAEIVDTIDAFGQAARRAREAGFDAVQIHAAHSKLFSQFLSPRSNQRTDQWGGNLENRMRFHVQVVSAIRKAVGQDYPVLIKLGVQDTIEGGLTLEEGCRVAQKLATCGIGAIEVSEGLEATRANHIRKDVKFGEGEAYYAEWAREVKNVVAVPVILAGGMRTFDIMERIVRQGSADCISMCRPFIREPDIIHRWQTNNRKPAKCISCNLCIQRQPDEVVKCIQELKLAKPNSPAEG
ncbi:tRNA-dihydrouridine synthase [Chloroflexota bacterium]